ncbi:MAG: TRAP transporter small permease subunit [Aquisalimonadaceae bacterium]
MKNFIRTIDTKLEDALSIVLYGYIITIVFLEVIYRYGLNNSIVWAEETAIYAFIWLTYISMAAVAKSRSHLCFTLIRDALPRPLQLALLLLSDVLLIVVSTVIIVYAYDGVSLNILFEQEMIGLRLPLWVATIAVPAGWFLVLLRTVQRAVISINDYRAGVNLQIQTEALD